jgi:hypothetical protein
MDKKYRVPIRIVFEGFAIVKTSRKAMAMILAKKNISGNIQPFVNEYSPNGNIIDYEILTKSTKTEIGFITLEK